MNSAFKRTALGLLVCTLVVLAWFSPWWLAGRNLAPLDLCGEMMRPWRAENAAGPSVYVKNHHVSDAADQGIIYRILAAESYRREGWVGWSSLTYGGTAQYANTMALYYDWTMQLHRWFEFWTAWHLGLMGQVMLAAWGMLLFLRGRSIGLLWACCGALAYAANSQFVTWIYHRWALGAFCWVPWILWAIDAYRRDRRGYWALVPVLLAMAFLGGTLQHAALVVLAVVAMWADEAWLLWSARHGERRRPAGCVRHPAELSSANGQASGLLLTVGSAAACAADQAGCLRSRWTGQLGLLGRYAAWGLLGVGLAAMMFLPCVEGFLTLTRLGLHTGMFCNPENGIYPEGRWQPLFNLAAYPFQIFPSALGRSDSMDGLKLFKSGLFSVAYFGSLPVLVAFLAAWRRPTPLLARVLIGCGLVLPLTPLVRFLYQRLFILFIFGGVLAFAHFMETASRETRLRVFRVTRMLAGIGIAGWTVLSVLLQLHPEVRSKLREKILEAGSGSSFGFFSDWMAGRTDRFIHDLAIWSSQQVLPLLLMGAALAGLRWSAALRGGSRRKGAWLVAMAVVGEVSLFGSRWVVWTDPVRYPLFPATPETAAVQELVGRDGRVTTLIHPTAHMACTPFIPNTLAPYGIATICGYDSIVPDGMILPNESAGDAEKLGRLGVSHLITWPGNSGVPEAWKPVWNSPSMALYENSLAMPKIMGFLTDSAKDAFFGGGRPEAVAIHETSGMENSRSLVVPTGVRWVRLAENQADGWEYRTPSSAAWVPVRRATDASMLLENPEPANPALITMRYDPPLRKLGFMVSAASLVFLILGQLVIVQGRHRHI